jgi:hypothetical protein
VKHNQTIPVPGSAMLASELKATVEMTELSQADVIRQSLKLGMAQLRARLGKAPVRRQTLAQHFKPFAGTKLPSYLE